MFKKAMSILMALLLLCLPMHAAAATAPSEETVQPLLDYTSYYSVSMDLSSGKAVCYTSVVGYSSLCTRIGITMTLQKKSVLWWSDVQSWSTSVSGYSANFEKTATSLSSGTYRVKAEIKVFNYSNVENLTAYSQTDSI